MTPSARFDELEYYLKEARQLYEAGKMEGSLVYLESATEELTNLMSEIEELT